MKTPKSENAQRKPDIAVPTHTFACDQSCFVLKISCITDNRMELVTATTLPSPGSKP